MAQMETAAAEKSQTGQIPTGPTDDGSTRAGAPRTGSPTTGQPQTEPTRTDPARTGPTAADRPLRVLLAPDKFQGSASAGQVAAWLAAGLSRGADRSAGPGIEPVVLPVADGGDGTVDAAVAAGSVRVRVEVPGPTGGPVRAAFALDGATAVVELAQASGLARLPGARPGTAGRRDPMRADTFGTGRVIGAALDAGARRIVLGLGGSASTDGGAGLLAALGVEFFDPAGRPLFDRGPDAKPSDVPHSPDASDSPLERLARADLSGLDERLADAEIIVACDVDNPLTGPDGAAARYGPQKGADPGQVARLDAGLARLVHVLAAAAADPAQAARIEQAATLPGAGAAGGAGFAALAVLGARLEPGSTLLLDAIGFADRLSGADLAVTGEGALDAQTLRGKAPAGVAAAARAADRPVVAVCGRCDLSEEQWRAAGFAAVYALTDLEPDTARCIADPGPLLERIGERIAADLPRILGRSRP